MAVVLSATCKSDVCLSADFKNLVGKASCRICLESFSTGVNALTEPIDMSVLHSVLAALQTVLKISSYRFTSVRAAVLVQPVGAGLAAAPAAAPQRLRQESRPRQDGHLVQGRGLHQQRQRAGDHRVGHTGRARGLPHRQGAPPRPLQPREV